MLSDGEFRGLPDTQSIIPFLGLYSIIVVQPHKEDQYRILTGSLPRLSVLRTDGFEFAPDGTSAGDPNVVRIFDVLAFPNSPIPVVLGQIPLSPASPDFAHRHLWRLPVAFPIILTTLLCSTIAITSDIEELQLALQIRNIIQSAKLGLPMMVSGSDGGGGGSGSGGGSNTGKEEDNDKSRKRTYDQFSKQDHERDQNRPEGGNNESDEFGESLHAISNTCC
jgi:hypothetical protein